MLRERRSIDEPNLASWSPATDDCSFAAMEPGWRRNPCTWKADALILLNDDIVLSA